MARAFVACHLPLADGPPPPYYLLLTTQVRIKLQGARGHVGKPGKGGKEQRQRAKARR